MWWRSKLLIYLMFFCLTFSCKKEKEQYSYNNKFYLDGLDKIEVMEYPSRFLWDTVKGSNTKELVNNGKLTFDSTFVKEKVILNVKQKKELILLFSQDSCDPDTSSVCYEPRHLILFRDRKFNIIAYREFCFECSNSRGSKNIEAYDGYCMGDIYKFLLKLNLNNKAVYDEEKRIVKEKYGH